PARFHSPRGCSRLLFEATRRGRLLRKGPYQRFRLVVEIVTEGLSKFFGHDPKKPVPVLTDVSRPHRRCSPSEKILEAFSFIESGSGQINETDNVWRVAGPRDDRATIGVPDQKSGSIQGSDQFARAVDVVGQRGERNLHGEDLVSFVVQEGNDMPPV